MEPSFNIHQHSPIGPMSHLQQSFASDRTSEQLMTSQYGDVPNDIVPLDVPSSQEFQPLPSREPVDTEELNSTAKAPEKPVVAVPASQSRGPCTNCGTNETPLWRRDAEGNSICNACGKLSIAFSVIVHIAHIPCVYTCSRCFFMHHASTSSRVCN